MTNKTVWLALGGLLGLTSVVAGTIIITNDLSNEQEYAGRGRDQFAETNEVQDDRIGNQVNESTTYETPEATVSYDAASYSLEEMITMAINDEYLAHKEYEIILDAYGNINPFANIINAEVTHIEELLPLFEAYDIAVPVDNAANLVALPSTLQEAYETGVQAEVNNIGMYERFLQEDLPQDVRDVFEDLMAASENHLQAFSRNASKY
jgi:hypothetical protein